MSLDSPIWPAQLDHFRIDAPDPAALADFYCDAIGYEAIDLPGGALLLQGAGRRLVFGKGEAHGRPYVAYRLASQQQLADVRRYLESQGVPILPNPSPVFSDDAVAVRDPDGWVTVYGIGRADLPSLKAANGRPPLSLPGRLQHFVVATNNLPRMIDFYESALGFRPSDYVLMDSADRSSKHVAFWRTDSEHHSFAAFGASSVRHDHHAYETTGWMDIRDWADHFANLEVRIWWGPGRHGAGNNLFFMVEDPLGDKIEISAEIETMPRDMAPRWWPMDGRAVNLWGAGWARD
jgi:catechol 2,3-dioxygenase